MTLEELRDYQIPAGRLTSYQSAKLELLKEIALKLAETLEQLTMRPDSAAVARIGGQR